MAMTQKQEDKLRDLKYRYESKSSGAPAAPRRMGPGGRHGRGLPGGGKPKDSRRTVVRLLRYLEEDKAKMVLAFVCVIANTVCMLAGSYMLRPIINTYIAPVNGSRGDIQGLARALIALGFVFLAGVAANYYQAKVMLTVAQNALQKIRDDLFTKMQKLPVRFYDTNSNGDLMSRFTNDVDTIGQMLSSTLVQLFSGALSLVGTLALMIYTNIWLTLVTLVMIPLVMRAGGAVAGRSQKYFSAQQSSLGAVNGYVEEMITGQKVIKVFCHEDTAADEFGLLNEDLRQNQIRAQFFGGVMGPVMNNLSQINYTLTAVVGGLLCVLRGFDVGGLTVFLNFSRQFSRPINEISAQVSNVFSCLLYTSYTTIFRFFRSIPALSPDLHRRALLHNLKTVFQIEAHVPFLIRNHVHIEQLPVILQQHFQQCGRDFSSLVLRVHQQTVDGRLPHAVVQPADQPYQALPIPGRYHPAGIAHSLLKPFREPAGVPAHRPEQPAELLLRKFPASPIFNHIASLLSQVQYPDSPTRADRLIQLLQPRIQLVIPPLQLQKLIVVTPLNDLAMLQHHDGVGIAHGGETVGDDKGGAVRHQTVHAVLDVLLRAGVHRAGGLVQNQDRRPGDGRPGNV